MTKTLSPTVSRVTSERPQRGHKCPDLFELVGMAQEVTGIVLKSTRLDLDALDGVRGKLRVARVRGWQRASATT